MTSVEDKNFARGFTLIEALVYIVLFSFVIGAGVASAFYLMQGTDELRRNAFTEAEANFVLRKIDWLLSNANSVSVSGPTLFVDSTTVQKTGSNQISIDSTKDLLSGNFEVGELSFVHNSSSPESVETTLIIEERIFHKIHYLR